MIKASILSIGDELLIGQVIDTNSVWLSEQLNFLGISIFQKSTVPDIKEEIIRHIDLAFSTSDIIIITGGLGPTADDLTKECLATYFQVDYIQDQKSLAHILNIFDKKGLEPDEQSLKQAEVPSNCDVLFNEFGTAPGMWIEKDHKLIISLPGVPHEMKTIYKNEIHGRFQKMLPFNSIIHQTFLITEIGESQVAALIRDIENDLPPFLKIAYLPGLGFLRLRLSGHSEDVTNLQTYMKPVIKEIKNRLGDHCVAEKDTTLEALIVEYFTKNELSLGTAESCTGGLVANKITNIPGSATVFKGSIVSYANETKENLLKVKSETLKEFGAVSEEVVIQMAQGALKALDVDYSVALSGILGPTGGSEDKPVGLVWLAVAHQEKTWTISVRLRMDRLQNKEWVAQIALNFLLKQAKLNSK